MRSTFAGLETAKRALATQQIALDTTGHNVSNANTVGYSRQIVNMAQTHPDPVQSMGRQLSVGTGVLVNAIERARDTFVDRQYRWETSKQSYWSGQEDALQKIEAVFNEPSDYSLSNDFDRFWSAWSDLAKSPENSGARAVLLERGATIVDSFHNINQQINAAQRGLDENIRQQIGQVNLYARQIKDYNTQIKRAEVAGDSPNDLRDQRDQVVDELSKLVNVSIVVGKDTKFTDRDVSTFDLYIGNENLDPRQLLLSDSTLNQLVEPDAPGADGRPFATVTWATGDNSGDGLDMGDKLGSLQALLQIRGSEDGDTDKDNAYIDNFKSKFDTLAKQFAAVINYFHGMGMGATDRSGDDNPNDFYVAVGGGDEITAGNIALNPAVRTDANKISTGLEVYTDGKIAQNMASLATNFDKLYENGWSSDNPPVEALSFGDYYGSVIAGLGVDVQQTERMVGGQDVLVTQMANRRESVSGVSLDEEMANLVKYQKSYSAAARVVTMLDDMLNTIVNGMGITR